MSNPIRRTSYGTDVRLDTWGMEWTVSTDEFQTPFYVTPCCDASAKGGEHGTICRKCHRPIDPAIGGVPVPLPADDRPEWRQSRERMAELNRAMLARLLGEGE